MISYQSLYGHPPPMYLIVNLERRVYTTVEDRNKKRSKMVQILRFKEVQNHMKQNVDRRKVEKEYHEGDMVYLIFLALPIKHSGNPQKPRACLIVL